MSGPFDALSDTERDALRDAPHPDWTAPMLATLTDDRFSDPGWLYERKLDGERALAFRDGDRVRLLTRNRKDLGQTYPEIAEALGTATPEDFVADGEIVAFEGGVTSFSRLQARMQIKDAEAARQSDVRVFYYLFDLLHLDGQDLTALPLRARKSVLKRAFGFADPIRFTPHRVEEGEAFFREACDKGWEGVIAKRADAPYVRSRSRDWLKFKCANGQELVIGGFTEPEGSRKGFGALLVGYYEDGALRYAGKVGTGFDDAFLESFRQKLDGISRKTAPFDDPPAGDDVTWLSPELVAEIGFTEWTSHGKLRHPRFLGLRDDKDPRDVTRERPAA
ncbi:non-homologous end-joining DNA ligase [Rhodosalinus sp. K401]|uniref:non-homologous end-joining DNA ligase n=1 Tax=Rhodosalinus sp. K401 TaxID=3239195 RepID=UPI003525C14B